MKPRFMTMLTGRDLPKIRHAKAPEPSIINAKMVVDFTRVVDQMGILMPAQPIEPPPDGGYGKAA